MAWVYNIQNREFLMNVSFGNSLAKGFIGKLKTEFDRDFPKDGKLIAQKVRDRSQQLFEIQKEV
jgi:hypothetical protein